MQKIIHRKLHFLCFLDGSVSRRIYLPLQEMQEMRVQPLGQEDPLEKKMSTHSRILTWKIPWTEEPGRLQSLGSQRVGHDWAGQRKIFLCTSLSLSPTSRCESCKSVHSFCCRNAWPAEKKVHKIKRDFPGAQMAKNPPSTLEIGIPSVSADNTLEKGMVTHSSILAWRIPWTEEPAELQSMGSQRVGHNQATFTSLQGKKTREKRKDLVKEAVSILQ